MTLQQFFLALRARWPLALVVFLLTAAAGLAVSLLLPPQYTASATLVVDPQSRDPLSAVLLPPGTMTTQEDIIKSDRVAQKVVKALKLGDEEAVKAQWRDDTGGKGRLELWLAGLLQRGLAVIPPRRDSNVLTIEYTAVDPGFAAAAANAFAQGYVETAVELKSQPARHFARWFDEQGRDLRAQLEKAQARLSQFQQAKGIVTKEENYDSETARLADLMSQLTVIQSQLADSRNKQRAGDNLPEVVNSSVVQVLRGDIARQEAKLKEAGLNFGANHPQYQRMQAELAELHAKLQAEARHVSRSFSGANTVSAGNERELKAAIDAQKGKLLDLRRDRDELAVLQRDVEAAQGAYAAVTARYTQTSLESQARQTNVSVLSAATEPLKPSSPNVARHGAIAAFFGVLLAIAAVFCMELMDRRLRSASEVAGLLQAPVLAVIKPARRRRLMSR